MGLSKKEKEDIMALALKGMNPRDIAKEVGKTELTVTRCLSKAVIQAFKERKQGQDGGGEKPPGDMMFRQGGGALISVDGIGMENPDELTKVAIASPQHAAQLGQMAGANIITTFNQAVRILGGRGKQGEKKAFLADLVGIVFGVVEGNESYSRVMPDEVKARKGVDAVDIESMVAEAVEKQSAENVKTIVQVLKETGVIK